MTEIVNFVHIYMYTERGIPFFCSISTELWSGNKRIYIFVIINCVLYIANLNENVN